MAKDEKKDAAPEEKKDEKKEEKKDKEAPAKEGDGGEGDAAAPKKSKKKLIIIGAAAAVLLAAAGGGAFFFLKKGGEHAEEGDVGADGKPLEKAIYYTLPEFLVNLNAGGKQSAFLKAVIVLELENQMDVISIDTNLPRLFDTFNTYLRELRPSDLAGSAGLQRLREELLLRANKALAPTKIDDVLFKEIIVQ